jgi:hypothetical protein
MMLFGRAETCISHREIMFRALVNMDLASSSRCGKIKAAIWDLIVPGEAFFAPDT